jgi:hypothetical protein
MRRLNYALTALATRLKFSRELHLDRQFCAKRLNPVDFQPKSGSRRKIDSSKRGRVGCSTRFSSDICRRHDAGMGRNRGLSIALSGDRQSMAFESVGMARTYSGC